MTGRCQVLSRMVMLLAAPRSVLVPRLLTRRCHNAQRTPANTTLDKPAHQQPNLAMPACPAAGCAQVPSRLCEPPLRTS